MMKQKKKKSVVLSLFRTRLQTRRSSLSIVDCCVEKGAQNEVAIGSFVVSCLLDGESNMIMLLLMHDVILNDR